MKIEEAYQRAYDSACEDERLGNGTASPVVLTRNPCDCDGWYWDEGDAHHSDDDFVMDMRTAEDILSGAMTVDDWFQRDYGYLEPTQYRND